MNLLPALGAEPKIKLRILNESELTEYLFSKASYLGGMTKRLAERGNLTVMIQTPSWKSLKEVVNNIFGEGDFSQRCAGNEINISNSKSAYNSLMTKILARVNELFQTKILDRVVYKFSLYNISSGHDSYKIFDYFNTKNRKLIYKVDNDRIINLNEFLVSTADDFVEAAKPIMEEFSSEGSNILRLSVCEIDNPLFIFNFVLLPKNSDDPQYSSLISDYRRNRFTFINSENSNFVPLTPTVSVNHDFSLSNIFNNGLSGKSECLIVLSDLKLHSSMLCSVKKSISQQLEIEKAQKLKFKFGKSTIKQLELKPKRYMISQSPIRCSHHNSSIDQSSINESIYIKTKASNRISSVQQIKSYNKPNDQIRNNKVPILTSAKLKQSMEKSREETSNDENTSLEKVVYIRSGSIKERIETNSSKTLTSSIVNLSTDQTKIRTLHTSLRKLKDSHKMLRSKILDTDITTKKVVKSKNEELNLHKTLIAKKDTELRKLVASIENKDKAIELLQTEVTCLKNTIKEEKTKSLFTSIQSLTPNSTINEGFKIRNNSTNHRMNTEESRINTQNALTEIKKRGRYANSSIHFQVSCKSTVAAQICTIGQIKDQIESLQATMKEMAQSHNSMSATIKSKSAEALSLTIKHDEIVKKIDEKIQGLSSEAASCSFNGNTQSESRQKVIKSKILDLENEDYSIIKNIKMLNNEIKMLEDMFTTDFENNRNKSAKLADQIAFNIKSISQDIANMKQNSSGFETKSHVALESELPIQSYRPPKINKIN